MTQAERLEKLRATLDPVSRMMQSVTVMKGDKGEDGRDGVDGKNGIPGRSIQGPEGKEGPMGPEGKRGPKGSDGRDGTSGRDGKNGSPDTADEIARKINTLKEAIDVEAIRGHKDLFKSIKGEISEIDRNFKKLLLRNQIHGGGLSTVAHDSTLTGDGTLSNPLSVVGGGAIKYSETPIGTINGANAVFTTVHNITFVFGIYMNGQYIHPAQYSTSTNQITFTIAPDASYAGLPFTIIYQ